MIWAIRQLSVPLNYLRIQHGRGIFHSKQTYDFVLPVIMALFVFMVFRCLKIEICITKNPDIIKRVGDLLQLLVAFYMAALAAVSTFDRKGLDEKLKGESATLLVRGKDGVRSRQKILTNRQFISYLFGYLSFLSLILFLFLIFFDAVWPKIELKFIDVSWVKHIGEVISVLFFAALWQLVFVSLLGIYFLTDRLQVLDDPDV